MMNKKLIYLLSMLCLAVIWVGCSDDEALDNLEPTGADPFTFPASESISDTEVIGTLMAEDNSNALTFSISVNSEDLFEVTPDGELSLAAGKSLDYETAKSHSIVVDVNDGNQSGSYVVTINVTDDPTDNIMASFVVTDTSVFELTDSTVVYIELSEPVLTEDYTVVVNIDPGTSDYGTDYVTIPDGTTGTFEVPIELGQSSTSFVVKITNDLEEEADETLAFTLDNGADDLIVPAAENATLDYTVVDDDLQEIYLYIGANSPDFASVYTINPKSGAQVYLTNLTNEDGSDWGSPFDRIVWSESNQTLFVQFSSSLYTVDLGTGVVSLFADAVFDTYEADLAIGNGQFNALHVEGDILYIAWSGSVTDDDFNTTVYPYLATMDVNTGTFSTTNELIDLGDTRPSGMFTINDKVYGVGGVIEFDGADISEYPYELNLADGTVGDALEITYSAEFTAVLGHQNGDRIFPDNDMTFDGAFITATASGFDDVSRYYVVDIDDATLELNVVAPVLDLVNIRGLTVVSTQALKDAGY